MIDIFSSSYQLIKDDDTLEALCWFFFYYKMFNNGNNELSLYSRKATDFNFYFNH